MDDPDTWGGEHIYLIHSNEDFEPFFMMHMLHHDPLYKLTKESREKIVSLYDMIHIPYCSFNRQPHDEDRMKYV
jgi:hypothetical protein